MSFGVLVLNCCSLHFFCNGAMFKSQIYFNYHIFRVVLRYFFLSSKLFTIDTNLLFKKKKTWIFLCHGLNPKSFWLWLECVICQSRILTILLCENFASSLLWTICNQLTFLHLILYLFKFPVLHFSEFKFWFKTWPVMNFLATAHYYHHHHYYCRHFAIAYI